MALMPVCSAVSRLKFSDRPATLILARSSSSALLLKHSKTPQDLPGPGQLFQFPVSSLRMARVVSRWSGPLTRLRAGDGMSFLNPVRLAFAGTFQADVSTVNNDVRHYDNAAFQPVFQDLQEPNTLNGWWNPEGSGAFRLIDCRVTGLWYSDGTSASTPSDDHIIGTWIGGSSRRTSGKIVDIDPQWQLASALWGLQVRLTAADGTEFMSGRYKPHPFRDLWFSRTVGQAQDGAASSTFQSVLEDVRWADDAASKSRFLSELSAASPDRLSIRLATFSYQGNIRDPRFTLGTVVGAIGPQLGGDPESFLAGRRFNPASGFSSWSGITYFTGLVDASSRQLFLDLSNALQIVDRPGTPSDIGRLVVGILTNPSTTENTPVSADTFVPIAEVPYRNPGWLQATGGILRRSDDRRAGGARGGPSPCCGGEHRIQSGRYTVGSR